MFPGLFAPEYEQGSALSKGKGTGLSSPEKNTHKHVKIISKPTTKKLRIHCITPHSRQISAFVYSVPNLMRFALRTVKEKWPFGKRPGSLRQSGPGVPSGVMVYLRVLARTERADRTRSCASFPSSSGPIAMSILCAVRWRTRAERSEWLCIQER